MKPQLSVICISFNTRDTTLACLTSLYQLTKGLEFEVIVVDNGSSDGSVEALTTFEQHHKNFKLIRSAINLGFGKANNLGAKEAKGKYLLFLNSDTLFTANNLAYCLQNIAKNKQIGAYSCSLVSRNGRLQPSGGFFPNLTRLIAWQFFIDDLPIIGKQIKSIHPHNVAGQVDWITGAFMIIPVSIFNQVGGFDENFFMYTEETELCYRIKKIGKSVVLDPTTSIIHLGGASGGTYLALTKEVEGWLYFWQKHRPAWQLPLVKFIFMAGSLLRFIIFGIIGFNATARKTYAQILRHTA